MKYRQLNLNLLIVLDHLIREKSVAKTAARLGLTQAAVSVQLNKLREHYEDELLAPRGRTLELSELARTLSSSLAEVLEKTEALLEMRARSTANKYGLDIYWRNVRTHTVHDPVSYRAREIGNFALNGVRPQPRVFDPAASA